MKASTLAVAGITTVAAFGVAAAMNDWTGTSGAAMQSVSDWLVSASEAIPS